MSSGEQAHLSPGTRFARVLPTPSLAPPCILSRPRSGRVEGPRVGRARHTAWRFVAAFLIAGAIALPAHAADRVTKIAVFKLRAERNVDPGLGNVLL